MKKALTLLCGIVLIVPLLMLVAGNAAHVEAEIKPVALPADLDLYLKESEARYADIVPGAEKTIVWAHAAKSRTPWSIIYLHGYSATRQETSPLSEKIAARLGANLFYTRLSGHGRSSSAMAEPSVDDWLRDATEALAIGQRLGEKVLVIGTSTGGTLATWLAEQPDAGAIAACILISPNYGPVEGMSELLAWPGGEQLAALVIGPEFSWDPANELQARYWTHRYPSKALVPMMQLVRLVRGSELEKIRTPVLLIYSPHDTVIDVAKLEQVFARWGAQKKELWPITQQVNHTNHILAGAILAPDHTDPVAGQIVDFVSRLP